MAFFGRSDDERRMLKDPDSPVTLGERFGNFRRWYRQREETMRREDENWDWSSGYHSFLGNLTYYAWWIVRYVFVLFPVVLISISSAFGAYNAKTNPLQAFPYRYQNEIMAEWAVICDRNLRAQGEEAYESNLAWTPACGFRQENKYRYEQATGSPMSAPQGIGTFNTYKKRDRTQAYEWIVRGWKGARKEATLIKNGENPGKVYTEDNVPERFFKDVWQH